jgi:hypothetical protein
MSPSRPSLPSRLRAVPLVALALMSGCSFAARSADVYRDDTRSLLERKNSDIKACYDENLKTDPKLSGTVVLKFKVRAKTGQLANVKVDPEGTTAPESITRCIVQAVDGLKLDPGDEREADASFRWEFQVPG